MPPRTEPSASSKVSEGAEEIIGHLPGRGIDQASADLAQRAAYGGFWGVSAWIPTHLVNVRGLSIEYMSVFSIVIFAGAFVGHFLFAALADSIIEPLYVLILDGVFLFGSYFAELFPLHIRAIGSGFAFNIGRGIGAVVTPVTIGACSVVFLTGAIVLFFMPETLSAKSSPASSRHPVPGDKAAAPTRTQASAAEACSPSRIPARHFAVRLLAGDISLASRGAPFLLERPDALLQAFGRSALLDQAAQPRRP